MSDEELEIVYENVASACTSNVQESSFRKNSDHNLPAVNITKTPEISSDMAHKIKVDTKLYVKNRLKTLKKRRIGNIKCQKQVDDYSHFKVVKNGTNFMGKVKDNSIKTVENALNSVKDTKENGLIVISDSVSLVSEEQNVQLSNHSAKSLEKTVSPVKNTEIVEETKENGLIENCDSISFASEEQNVRSSNHSVKPLKKIVSPVKETKENGFIENNNSISIASEQNVRVSKQLIKSPNKFFINGSPASSKKNRKYFSKKGETPIKKKKSPSLLSFMRNKFPLRTSPVAAGKIHSPDKKGVKRKLNFSGGLPSHTSESSTSSYPNDVADSEFESTRFSEIYDGGFLLRQLKMHIDTVLAAPNTCDLINEEERNTVISFFSMDIGCQDFYARMHHRKYKWNRLSDIKYESAVEENLAVLKDKGFFLTDASDIGLKELLDLLKCPEVKQLCKSLGLKKTNSNKMDCSQEVIQYCQKQKTIGFQFQIGTSEDVVRKKIEKMLGPCFTLHPEPRGLFRRIHLLFNLQFNRNEQSSYGSQELFEIQFLGTNKSLYPNYTVDKKAKIFFSREDLLGFQTAEDLKCEFTTAVEDKKWDKADIILSTIRDNFVNVLYGNSMESVSADELALCLRKYTPGTLFAYALYGGVDVSKKLKKTEQAISDLILLLDQTTYLPYMRGRWYEKMISIRRTAASLEKVAETIIKGMSDPYIDDQCRYVMSLRVRELLKKKKGVSLEIKNTLRSISLYPPLECVEPNEINASALDGKSGYKRVYIQDDETGDGKTYSSVEEFVKNHYCRNQFKYGIHAENSLAISLFGILFWDIIYECEVPCVFISPYQTRPLDLSTGEFYKNRKSDIDTRLQEMENWTTEKLSSWVKNVYDMQSGKSSVVHWNWFRSSDNLVDIINCIGLPVVLKICERFAKKYRSVRSGFPDLFLWTPGQRNQYMFVEVKGPNDTLGVNQKLWLDFLIKISANVEVCLVKAHGSKTMKPNIDTHVHSVSASTHQDEVDIIEDPSSL